MQNCDENTSALFQQVGPRRCCSGASGLNVVHAMKQVFSYCSPDFMFLFLHAAYTNPAFWAYVSKMFTSYFPLHPPRKERVSAVRDGECSYPGYVLDQWEL